MTWATRGLVTSAVYDLGLGGADTVVWGFLLEPWYEPAALTVTWGAVGTTPRTATWMVQTAVPEPSAIMLVLTGIGLLVWTRQRRATTPRRPR